MISFDNMSDPNHPLFEFAFGGENEKLSPRVSVSLLFGKTATLEDFIAQANSKLNDALQYIFAASALPGKAPNHKDASYALLDKRLALSLLDRIHLFINMRSIQFALDMANALHPQYETLNLRFEEGITRSKNDPLKKKQLYAAIYSAQWLMQYCITFKWVLTRSLEISNAPIDSVVEPIVSDFVKPEQSPLENISKRKSYIPSQARSEPAIKEEEKEPQAKRLRI